MSGATSITGLGQVAVNIRDLDRAVAFYRDTLGLPLLFTVPPKMAFFACGGARLMLALPESPEFDHRSSILYFTVADIRAAATELERRGLIFESPAHLVAKMPDHDLWMAFFRDTEDNVLALMSEVRP